MIGSFIKATRIIICISLVCGCKSFLSQQHGIIAAGWMKQNGPPIPTKPLLSTSYDGMLWKLSRESIIPIKSKSECGSGNEDVEDFLTTYTIEYVLSIRDDRDKLEQALENGTRIIKSPYANRPEVRSEVSEINGQIKFVLASLKQTIVPGLSRFVNRVESIGFSIRSEELKHSFDVERLLEYVLQLFDWFSQDNVRARYLAPCFPLVQSSGTGKTKLLYELRQLLSNHSTDDLFSEYDCRTILCVPVQPTENLSDIFSSYLVVKEGQTAETRVSICEGLNEVLSTCKNPKVVLLFDESQILLRSDGFAFRCVRWWLRDSRRNQQNVVAVFTGTTSRLTNYYAEPPPVTFTRDPKGVYYSSGSYLYKPFYSLYTTGIFTSEPSEMYGETEYEKAIPHGRPLFAVMQKGGLLTNDKLYSILRRMLLGNDDFSSSPSACLSILGTRIQMGQTSVDLLSDLIAGSYATLTYYSASPDDKPNLSSNIARVCFEPDPVCARLAMCIMDAEWSISSEGVALRGMNHTFWTGKISESFSTGLCLPNQGNLGELAGASYMLFCGDVLRKRIDPTYNTFSVALIDYVVSLAQHQQPGQQLELSSAPSSNRTGWKYSAAHVSFIQVVRNYMRFPLKDLGNLDILKDMYNAGIAYYTYPMCEAFDLVGSIRLTALDGSFHYAPLAVSISTKRSLGANVAALTNMTKAFREARVHGMGIRLVFDMTHKKDVDLLSSADVNTLLSGQNVFKVLVVHRDDPFGIVQLLLDTVSDGPVECEIDSSKYFLRSPKLRRFNHTTLLRSKATIGMRNYLKGAIDKSIPKSTMASITGSRMTNRGQVERKSRTRAKKNASG